MPPTDYKSLTLVLFAFIGNARVFGIDLVLVTIFPIALLLWLGRRWSIPSNTGIFFVIISMLMIILALRSYDIQIWYFEPYFIWPIKALILTTLVITYRSPTWPIGNTLILTAFVIILLAMGDVENGRFNSLFGPNMLYRIFGILLLLTLMSQNNSKLNYFTHYTICGIAIFGIFLTASIGALLVLVVILIAYVSTKVSTWRLVLYTIPSTLITYLIIRTTVSSEEIDSINLLARLAVKISTMSTNVRLVGWSEIMNQPMSFFGYDHYHYNQVWGKGYLYPHNIYVELYAYYGLLGIVAIVAISISLLKSLDRIKMGEPLSITFLILLIGSMLSGDLSDNYGVIGLAMGMIMRPKINKVKPVAFVDNSSEAA